MQIKSWQIALVGLIFQILGFTNIVFIYLKVEECLRQGGGVYCGNVYIYADLVKILLIIFGIGISFLMMKSKGWKAISSLLFIIISIPQLFLSGYGVILDKEYSFVYLSYLTSSIFLLTAGIYYFWKKV